MRLPHVLPRALAVVLPAGLLAAGLSAVPPASAAPDAAPAAAPDAAKRVARTQTSYAQVDGGKQFRRGRLVGTRFAKGTLIVKKPNGSRRMGGTTYDRAYWTSAWVRPGFSFTELIPSFDAVTPGDTWVEVRVRGRNAAGKLSSWDVMASWAAGDAHVRRRTSGTQADDLASVNVDTWKAPQGLVSYQLKVSLFRRAGTTASPRLDTVGAVASRVPAGVPPTSRPGPGRGTVLSLPRYSQMIHQGDYPQWDGGGEAWCSPTSTSMVLGYYHRLPTPSAYRFVPAGHPDPWVDYAARRTYDYAYEGAGNWPFNTAYAANRTGHAFVTRLRNLRDAEVLVKAGIPVVASISFGPGELDGAPISSTGGHLLVIVGFTRSGDVVVNDPAASDRRGVRRTYDRGQLERAWLGGSGGTAYVIRDDAHPLPDPARYPAW